MSLSVVLAIGSMVLAGLSDFLYKRAQLRGIRPGSYLVVQSACFNVTSAVLALLTDGLIVDWTTVGYALPAALVLFSAYYLFLRSLRGGDLTVNVPIFRLSFVVTAILAALLLGERLSVIRLLAIGLAALGVLALADLRKLVGGCLAGGSLALLLAATGLLGVSAIIYKAALLSGALPGAFLTVQASLFLLCGVVLSLATDGLRPTPATPRYAPLTGVLLACSLFLLLLSLRTGEASVSVPISQLSFVLTSLLAVAFLGERLGPGRLVGTAAAALAVVVFNLPDQLWR